MSDWRETIQMFEDAFAELQKERDKRSEWVDDGNGRQELAWVLYERKGMLEYLNMKRSDEGLPPVTEDIFVSFVETRACGHFDYTRQLAVGCAYLSRGRNPRNPEAEL